MTDTHYEEILRNAFSRFAELIRKRDEAEVEIAKLRQFINATLNMVPDDLRQEFTRQVRELVERYNQGTESLTEAVRRILQENPDKFHTAAMVRDHLLEIGFDFSSYTANPLASISTTLKRLKPEEVDTATVEGAIGFRWRRRMRHVSPSSRRKTVPLRSLLRVGPSKDEK